MRAGRRLRIRSRTAAALVALAVLAAACTDVGAEAARAVPSGKYNCYLYGASRPMPWEPGYGGAFEIPNTNPRYVMNITILDGRNYQYVDRGTGTYRYDARTQEISWVSGPFADGGFRSAFDRGTTGRPVIFLELDDIRTFCVGPAGA